MISRSIMLREPDIQHRRREIGMVWLYEQDVWRANWNARSKGMTMRKLLVKREMESEVGSKMGGYSSKIMQSLEYGAWIVLKSLDKHKNNYMNKMWKCKLSVLSYRPPSHNARLTYGCFDRTIIQHQMHETTCDKSCLLRITLVESVANRLLAWRQKKNYWYGIRFCYPLKTKLRHQQVFELSTEAEISSNRVHSPAEGVYVSFNTNIGRTSSYFHLLAVFLDFGMYLCQQKNSNWQLLF